MPVRRILLYLLLRLRALRLRPADHGRLFPHRLFALLYRYGPLFHRLSRLLPLLNRLLLKLTGMLLLLHGDAPLLRRLPRLLPLHGLLLKLAGLLLLPDRYRLLLLPGLLPRRLLLPLHGSLPELARGKPVCRNALRPVIPLVVHHLSVLI